MAGFTLQKRIKNLLQCSLLVDLKASLEKVFTHLMMQIDALWDFVKCPAILSEDTHKPL